MNRLQIPDSMGSRVVLAEFPHGWASVAANTYRAGDGFGNVGTGTSWEDAAANLRSARAEREALAARLDAEAAEARERFARVVGNVILWGFVVAALVVAVLR